MMKINEFNLSLVCTVRQCEHTPSLSVTLIISLWIDVASMKCLNQYAAKQPLVTPLKSRSPPDQLNSVCMGPESSYVLLCHFICVYK